MLTTLLLYRSGFYVGKYVSLEAQITKNKDLYYNALVASHKNTWMNLDNEPVGIGIHFEIADDVHYEMTYESWMDFLHKELCMGQEMCNLNIPAYFEGKTWMQFENRLRVNGITFQKFHF